MRIRRVPVKGTSDFRLLDAEKDEDLARVSGKQVLYSEETARELSRAVNGQVNLERRLEEAERELAQFRVTAKDLKPIDLCALSRIPDRAFTTIDFADDELRKFCPSWLKFGSCEIRNEGGRHANIGARIRDGITDFEHDSCWVVSIDIIGLQYKFTAGHTTYMEAVLTTNHENIRIRPADFVPEQVQDAWRCDAENCDKHLMMPEGFYVPPVYAAARFVAGQRIEIRYGTKWPDEEA